MKILQLHEKYTEEIIGSVVCSSGNEQVIMDAWDSYQKEFNSNLDSEPDIYDFAEKNNLEVCEVDFYQP